MTAAHHDNHGHGAGSDEHKMEDPRTAIDAQSAELLSAPIDFLYAEHLRQRQAAKIIALIADGVINRRTICATIEFIRNDLPMHILDEETSLFPILRRRCPPDDKIDELLSLLAADHRDDERISEEVVAILRKLASGESANDADQSVLRRFADHVRHHLALENGVLIPIARARLNDEMLSVITQSMIARRRSVPRP
ncbi:MAG: hemerythrin domain-containing protein [Pseudomonadota bacterium]